MQKKESKARPLRVDAARNRARLLVAADATFRELGAAASFEEIAKRAQVGVGTVYRHFETHEALLAAVCDERLLAIAAKAEDYGDDEDVLDQLADYLEQLALAASFYNGLAASFGVVLESHTPGCDACTAQGERLVARAKKEKRMASGVDPEDLTCIITAVALAAQKDRSRAKRLVRMFIDGIARD